MSQYGDRRGEDWRDLSHEPEGTPAECKGCHKTVEADDLDEDGLCPDCEAEDDELEFTGDEEEDIELAERISKAESEEGPDWRDAQDHDRDMCKDGETLMADLRVRR